MCCYDLAHSSDAEYTAQKVWSTSIAADICQFCETVSPGCEPPTGIAASSITSSTAKISWTAIPEATAYSLQYRKLGTTRWKTKQSSGASLKLNKLSPATTYEYQVATLCSTETSE
jgi:hypothetical protein